jgi:lambda family phage portal protein
MGKKKQEKKAKQAKQAAHNAASQVQARYDAAGHGRKMAGWKAPGSGPNRAQSGMETLRNRLHDAIRNEWQGKSGQRVWTTNLIGTGIIPRHRVADAEKKARFKTILEDFIPLADADGNLDFYGLQTLAVRAWVGAGEVFARLRPRRASDGLEVPLQVQLLEAEMVPLLDLDSHADLPSGHYIRSGKEFDAIGRPVAWWCYREHPGDADASGASLSNLTRVPVSEMLHMYEPQRIGQIRGVSDLATVLVKLRSLTNLDDAVLTRQELANLFAMFITRPPAGAPVMDPLTGLPVQQGSDGSPWLGLQPGISQELAPGEDVRFSEPPDAGANYADFSRQQHLGVAAGWGTPYELMTGDIRDVSDRTLRVVINEFRRFCQQRQWQIIIPMLCQPIIAAVGKAAVLTGRLAPEELRDFARVHWSPQGWEYIHPTQDAQGKQILRDMGVLSETQIILERGDDPDEVGQQYAEDAARREANAMPTAQQGSPVSPEDGDEADDKTDEKTQSSTAGKKKK